MRKNKEPEKKQQERQKPKLTVPRRRLAAIFSEEDPPEEKVYPLSESKLFLAAIYIIMLHITDDVWSPEEIRTGLRAKFGRFGRCSLEEIIQAAEKHRYISIFRLKNEAGVEETWLMVHKVVEYKPLYSDQTKSRAMPGTFPSSRKASDEYTGHWSDDI